MERAIQAGATPNLVLLRYDAARWTVRDVEFIPSFAFTLSSIEKRPPLSENARRFNWVGCNIVIGNVPADLRIGLVRAGEVLHPRQVREQYQSVTALRRLGVEQRGWTLDVLNVVRRLRKQHFTLAEVYASADELAALHPHNRHVKPKIRQQLQVLRDLGFLEFVGDGRYSIRCPYARKKSS